MDMTEQLTSRASRGCVQSFDGLIMMSVDLGTELNAVAEGLLRMAPDNPNITAATLSRSLIDTLRVNQTQVRVLPRFKGLVG